MLLFILWLVVVGLIAGFVARAVVPGRDRLTIGQTILLGIVGSFVGGLLGYLIFEIDLEEGALQPSGLLGSIIGAVLALIALNAMRRGRRSGLRRVF